MGRTLEDKKQMVAELQENLKDAQMAIVIDYQGLTVAELTDLRNRLRPTGTDCKVAKNTLMRIAVEGNDTWSPITQFCKESTALLLLKDDLKAAVEAYQAFQKASKKTTIRGGVMEGRALNEDQIKAVTDLPSKEELMARIAGGINLVSTKLAVGLNAVPTKLAIGIKEVPSSLVRAIKAVSEKEDTPSS